MSRFFLAPATLALSAALVLTSCSTSPESSPESSPKSAAGNTSTATSATATAAASSAALTISNCGNEWSFATSPQRVVVMKNTTPATLEALGVLDRVVAKAGVFPAGYYSDAVNDQLATIPSLSEDINASGHLQISREDVLAQSPDLVVGFNDTVNVQTMGDIPIVDEPALCGEATRKAQFDDIYEHVNFYGTIFDRQEQAQAYNAELEKRIEQAQRTSNGQGRTVAILWPSIGGGALYAYGSYSMSTTVAEQAGLKPIFGQEQDRVFEVSTEQVIAAHPDVIIALHSTDEDNEAQRAVEEIKKINGAADIPAVKNDAIIPMLFNRMDPPTPLAVDGLEELNAALAEL